MKKSILTIVIALLITMPALAWQEGPGTDWWYINAQYDDYYVTGPLIIEIDGDSSTGQTFFVGDTIQITCDVHAYAASCAGSGNEAYTNAELDVSGPSGDASDDSEVYDGSDSCAEVDNIDTLIIGSYVLTTPGVHTVYVSSNVQVAQYDYYDVAEETIDDFLTFEVLVPTILVEIDIKPGSDPNPINLGSNGLIPVAILSSETFDATTVDPETVFLGGVGVAVRGKGSKLMAHVEDVNGDGLDDLVVQVETEGLSEDEIGEGGVVLLTGETYDGTSIEGSDVVVIVPPEE